MTDVVPFAAGLFVAGFVTWVLASVSPTSMGSQRR